MKYTDKDMVDSSQIAYLNFLQDGIDNLNSKNANKKQKYTIEQIVRAKLEVDEKETDFRTLLSNEAKKTKPKLSESQIRKLLSLSDEAYQWKILDIQDSNERDGFFACTIDKGNGDAIVAFRGSESLDSPENILHDWLNADAGFLNSKQTYQQRDAEDYIEKLIHNKTLNDAKSIGVAGHSLGGNLADHFTIMSVGTELESKIERCVSLDGPGFSNEYIEEHRDKIEVMAGKCTHYEWSIVGACLNELPGEKVFYPNVTMFNEDSLITEKINENEATPNDKAKFYSFTCHDTRSLDYDSEGMIDCNTYPSSAIMISKLVTNYLDDTLDAEVITVAMFFGTWVLALWMDAKNGNHDQINNLALTITDEDMENLKNSIMSPAFIAFVYAFVTKALIPFITFIAPFIPYILVAMAVVAICYLGYKFFEEYGEYILTSIKFFLIDKYNDFKDIIEEEYTKFLSCFKGIKRSFLKEYWGAYRYAYNNPYLDMNTDTLRTYANRLQNVNNRLANVESRIKGLYLHVGLVDILTIMKADILVNYSTRLNKCINYLENTANRFDDAENKILNAF